MIYRQSEETLSLAQILDADPNALRTVGNPVMIARWLLALAVCSSVLFYSPELLAPVLRQSFVGAVLAFTIATTWALHAKPSRWLRTVVALIDIGIVSAAIVMVENASTEFFLVYLVVVTFAAQGLSRRVRPSTPTPTSATR